MKKILKIFMFVMFLISMLGVNSVYAFPESIKLEYNPEIGSSNRFLMVMTALTTMEGNFGNAKQTSLIESTAKVNSIFTQNINSVDKEGNLNMELVYNDVSFEIEQGGEKTTIPLGDKIGGKSIHLKVSKEGKILDIKELKDLPKEFREFDLQKLYPQVNPYFPPQEIKVGDTWTQEINESTPLGEEGMLLKQKMKIDYILSGFEQIKEYQCAIIGVKMKIDITGEWKQKDANSSSDLGIKSRGEGSGTMRYAYKLSKPISSSVNIDLNTQMKMGAEKEQEATIKQKIEISVDVIK